MVSGIGETSEEVKKTIDKLNKLDLKNCPLHGKIFIY